MNIIKKKAHGIIEAMSWASNFIWKVFLKK